MTTPANTSARAATSPELAKFRADGQWARLGLAIQHPVTVYSARINQTFDSLDGVIELVYDGGSGTLADVKEGMTIFIGSSVGAHDKGVTYIRKTPTSTKFYIRPTSNISFADNDHVTVIDAFSLWSKPIYNRGGVIQMDTDVEFGDLTRGGILPRLGPLAAVVNQASGTLTFVPPNPSLSAGYDGATVASYAFSAPGASSTSNMSSATSASWVYPLTADGEYRWSCAITDSLGRVTTSYRRVFVNPSEIAFEVNDVQGDFETGGWSFEVTALADVDDIYDRAMVTLYVRDYHAGAEGAVGKLSGFENIIASGWVDGESISQDDLTGRITFTVQGPAFWMDKVLIDPFEIRDTFAEPVAWNEVQELTVDKALALVLYWMSTAPLFMDCFLTGDEKRVRTLPVAGGSLWSQLNALAADKLFAHPACNNYGQLFIEVDQQIADSTTRAAFPVVMNVTSDDYEPPFELDRINIEKTAMLQLGGLQNADGVTDIFLYSRAPGNVPINFGQLSTYDNYILEDAAETRRISGQLLALENNEFEPLTLLMPAANRLFDIAPRMVATLTTDSADNPRGIALSSQRLIPRRVKYSFENNVPKIEVTFELEVTGVDGVDYVPPTAQDDNMDDAFEGFDGVDFPAMDDVFPETVPTEVTTPCNRNIGNYFQLTWSPRALTGSTSTLIAKAYFPCTIRATGGLAGDTKIILDYHAFGDANDHKTCYAVNNGTRVLTGTWDDRVITFSPASDTEITGFEIELDAGAGATISKWEIGKLLETGDIIAGATNDMTTMLVDGEYYCMGAYQGYWTATYPPEVVGRRFYNVQLPGFMGYLGGNGRDGFGDFHLDDFGITLYATYGFDFQETFDPTTQSFARYGNYAYLFFRAGIQQETLKPSDVGTLGSTAHNMKWALWEAQAIGRKLVIGSATLYNVCALSS